MHAAAAPRSEPVTRTEVEGDTTLDRLRSFSSWYARNATRSLDSTSRPVAERHADGGPQPKPEVVRPLGRWCQRSCTDEAFKSL